MRVAFASSNGERIDAHFGQASRFYLWDIRPESAECVGTVEAPEGEGIEERTVARADALAGCAMVCSVQVGGPAAARLASRHVHPLKVRCEEAVSEVVRQLQRVLRFGPPPWLKRRENLERELEE